MVLYGSKKLERDLPMSSEIAIKVSQINKCYQIYEKASDRLKQALFHNRRKYFREFWALRDISFELRRGQTLGIVGKNGSGKSTLLQIICGTLNPTSGDFSIKGRVAALLELGSGFNPEFSGRENVYLNASLFGLTQDEIDSKFNQIIEFADIGSFINQPVKTYSSGMAVRLAFAVLAHVDADILVIDEALAVGDVFFTQKCMRFLRSFMETGTVVFVSHDTNAVKSLCNRAIWIEDGRILYDGDPKSVCERYLEAYYSATQRINGTGKKKLKKTLDVSIPKKDQRESFINNSNLRNDLKVFDFNIDCSSFGAMGAEITDVLFTDLSDAKLAWIVGGETVVLKIHVNTHRELAEPIIGFSVKDRLGQILFGDNTYLSYLDQNLVFTQGVSVVASFVFIMPILPVGDYSVSVAIANGTQEVHEQQHWIHDAIFFKSEASSVTSGLVGIPMLDIRITK